MQSNEPIQYVYIYIQLQRKIDVENGFGCDLFRFYANIIHTSHFYVIVSSIIIICIETNVRKGVQRNKKQFGIDDLTNKLAIVLSKYTLLGQIYECTQIILKKSALKTPTQ